MNDVTILGSKIQIHVIRPWTVALIVPVAMIILRASPLAWMPSGTICGLLLLLVWILNSIWSIALIIRFAQRGLWVNVFPCVIVFSVFVLSVVTLPHSVWFVNNLGDETHFLIMRHNYLTKIAQIPPSPEPRLVVFELGGMIGASSAIVYDESDELAIPSDKRSKAWWDRAEKTQLSCEPIYANAFLRFTGLTHHFYMVTYAC